MDIGLILGAFGIKGEIRIMSLHDDPERFLELESIVVAAPDGTETIHKIEKVRVHKGLALVKFSDISDRDIAESMKDSYVRLAEGDHSAAEKAGLERTRLVGLEVFTVDGDRLGVLEEVIQTGANDVYEVRDGKKTVLLPAISQVIKSVDHDNGRMVVEPLPGLL